MTLCLTKVEITAARIIDVGKSSVATVPIIFMGGANIRKVISSIISDIKIHIKISIMDTNIVARALGNMTIKR